MNSEWVRLHDIKRREVNTEVVEIDHETVHKNGSTTRPLENWQPGLWSRFPWLAAICLVCSVLLSITATIVLNMADKTVVSHWDKRIAPNVIITILNNTSGICIAVAVVEGLAIAWWRKAMHGATLEELHNAWSFGISPVSIIRNYKQFNFVALAALVTKIYVVDGVLFQRAITTYIALGPVENQIILTYPTDRIPPIAEINSFGNDTGALQIYFNVDVSNWISSQPPDVSSTMGYRGCQGICALNISAPGYIVKCTNQTQSIDIVADAKAKANSNMTVTTSTTDIFGVEFSINWPTAEKNYTWIGVNTTSYTDDRQGEDSATAQCPGTLMKTQCEMRQAMINYPIHIEQLSVSTTDEDEEDDATMDVSLGETDVDSGSLLDLPAYDAFKGQFGGFDFQHWIDTGSSQYGNPGRFTNTSDGGIYRALQDQFESRKYVTTASNGSTWSVSTEGQFARMADALTIGLTLNTSCPGSQKVPVERIISSLNVLTFITADDPRNRPEYMDSITSWSEQRSGQAIDDYFKRSERNVTAQQRKSEPHYSIKRPYMYGALSATILCVLLILPVYWGFWELGRRVSLNPIEVANAFHAPMLASLHPNSGYADDIVKVAGQHYVRYAPTADPAVGGRHRMILG